MTEKLYQIQTTRDRKIDIWPLIIPGLELSTCKDAHWVYEVSSDRKTMRIHYSRKLDWEGKKGFVLPMEYSATISAGK